MALTQAACNPWRRRAIVATLRKLGCLWAAGGAGLWTPCQADDAGAARRLLPAVVASKAPTIDGDLSDPAWARASLAQGFVDQQNGNIVSDQTVVRIAYDRDYIYVSFRCFDSDPEGIVARETVRDHKFQRARGGGFGGGGGGNSEDSVDLALDTFRTSSFSDVTLFSINPLGTRSAYIAGGRASKAEWKGDWEAAAKRDAQGWTAEMRIPWPILSFPSKGGKLDMGINFVRYQERTKVQSVWSNTGPQKFLDRQGVWQGVEPPASDFRSKLSLLPYILPGMARSDPSFRSGLDARLTLTPELTAVATVNPDFATIEGAVEGIAFSRSERFVPEKRPFFLEGRDYLDAGQFFAIGPYFYPNRIERFDVGAKVYGKITPNDAIGILGTVDAGDQTNFIGRYRRTLSSTSEAGVFLSQRSGDSGDNTVGVLLQRSRWGKLGFSSEWAFSAGPGAGGGAKRINWYYEDKHLFSSLAYRDVSPSYLNKNGLAFFTDFRGFNLFQNYEVEWRNGPFRSVNVFFYPQVEWHANGKPFRRGAGSGVQLTTRSDWSFFVGTEYLKFDSEEDLVYQVGITKGVSNRFSQIGAFLNWGRQGGRPYTFVSPHFSFRVLKKLDVLYGGGLRNIDGSQQQHVLTLNYEVSPTRSFGGRVVVEDANTNWYVSYRNAGERGTETFFIIGDPNAPRFREQVAVKLVFAI